MCGLAGIFDFAERREINRLVLSGMNETLFHRGPDGGGEHLGAGIGLAHRRLAIIDIGGGKQPMYNEDGTIAVVFNGELYNYKALVQELEAAGHVFRSHCDTEVIVHAYEQWGPDAVCRFHGMFAFALWDDVRETLVLARDHLGKKPLYYARSDDGFLVFGSELKAVTCFPGLSSRLDPLAIADYFTLGYVPDPRSIYASVRKLPPGHLLVWRRRAPGPRMEAFWDLQPRAPYGGDLAGASDELIARLREATRMRMISDVPLGAFLSGGVDSSAIVGLMAGLSADPVKTFSISFADPEYDESGYASRVAARYRTNHHTREVNPDDFEIMDRLATIYDEPFGDSSAMPTFRVCALAREQVTVALSGDGGDELFAGYRRYAMHLHAERVREALPPGLRAPLFGLLGRVYPKADWAPRWLRAKTTLQELAVDSCGAYFRAVSATSDEQRERLFNPSFRRELQGYSTESLIRGHWDGIDTDDVLLKAQYTDLKTWLPGSILVKVDRASMANSLEVRAPLLDYALAEWSAGLPRGFKIRGNEGKLVLKRAAERLVDRALIYRPKRGFSMPLARWFRGPLRSQIEALGKSEVLGAAGIFDLDEVRRLAERHISGRRDHSAVLWLLLIFDAFLANSHGGREHPRNPCP